MGTKLRTNVDSNMADDCSVVWESDIFVFIVHTIRSDAIFAIGVIIDYESSLDVDFD